LASVWLHSALWIGLALLASLISIRVTISVALIEIVVGAFAGNLIGLQITEWVNFLAGFGAILLTFLAGTEIDPGLPGNTSGPAFRSASSVSSRPISASLHTRTTYLAGLGRRRRSPESRCRRRRSRSSMP
jgi:hypothetical protein